LTSKSSRREGDEDVRRRPKLKSCLGAGILASLGLYVGYLFIFMVGTWLSIIVGITIVILTGYLIWNYLKHG
jgi:hypothetical protein